MDIDINKLAAVIKNAIAEAPYFTSMALAFKDRPDKPAHVILGNEILFSGEWTECENECERLNSLYIAQKAVEAINQ